MRQIVSRFIRRWLTEPSSSTQPPRQQSMFRHVRFRSPTPPEQPALQLTLTAAELFGAAFQCDTFDRLPPALRRLAVAEADNADDDCKSLEATVDRHAAACWSAIRGKSMSEAKAIYGAHVETSARELVTMLESVTSDSIPFPSRDNERARRIK